MRKLGVIVQDFGPTQLTYQLVRSAEKVRSTIDICAFFNRSAKHSFPLPFACMQLNEAWGYDGLIIATDIKTCLQMKTFPASSRKVFYVWDLDWMRIQLQDRDFDFLSSLYRSDELTLVARSVSHSEALRSAWNIERIAIVENFNLEGFFYV